MSTKRILSLVLALVMVLGTFSTMVFAETANEKVEWLKDQGIVEGNEKGELNLDKTIDRASVAKLVVEALDLGAVAEGMKNYKTSFTDVPVTHWANGYINVVSARGIMIGNAGKFMPGNQISYAEVLTILVRIMDGLTADEEKAAVWPTTYIAKAHELGILEDVTVVSYQEAAIRERIFEMFYNAMTNMEVGNYHIVKGIVLENYRVENLSKDEIVIEVIQEVQKADFAKENRKGDQPSLKIPAKVADVENLLGKVADFSINKAGEVVKVKIDDTYKYEVGQLSAIRDELTIGNKSYTVVIDERYEERDDRVFRTYENNRPYAYRNYGTAIDYKSDNVRNADFARVTVKNGKVLFIDAFVFDDIAPVQEVRNDGKAVYVYDDARDGAIKKVDFTASTKVIAVDGTEVSVANLTDIEEMTVIHTTKTGNTVLVRLDAALEGQFERVRYNKDDHLELFVDDEAYVALVKNAAGRRAVYSTDLEEFRTLEMSRQLDAFKEKDVVVLLDMNDNVQYISTEVPATHFLALVKKIVGTEVQLLTEKDKTENYRVNLDSVLHNSRTGSQESKLNGFNIGGLVKVSVDEDGYITSMVQVAENPVVVGNWTPNRTPATAVSVAQATIGQNLVNGDLNITNSRFVTVDNVDAYVNAKTLVFINTSKEMAVTTVGNLINNKVFKQDKFEAYMIYSVSQGDNVANVIVVTDLDRVGATHDELVLKFDRYIGSGAARWIRAFDESGEPHELQWVGTGLLPENLRQNDIFTAFVRKTDNTQVETYNIDIPYNTARVYEVVSIDQKNARIELNDGNLYWLDEDMVLFGTSGLLTRDRIQIVTEGRFITVASKVALPVTGGQVPVDTDGVVTYINATDKYIMLGDVKYTLTAQAVDILPILEKDQKIAFKTVAGKNTEIYEINVIDGKDVVVDDNKVDISGITFGQNLTIKDVKAVSTTVTSQNVTVKGNLVVDMDNFKGKSFDVTGTTTINGANVEFNSTLRGNVIVNATGVKLTNVKLGSDLVVNANKSVTLAGKTTIAGDVELGENVTINTNDLEDETAKDKVEKAEEDKEMKELEAALKSLVPTLNNPESKPYQTVSIPWGNEIKDKKFHDIFDEFKIELLDRDDVLASGDYVFKEWNEGHKVSEVSGIAFRFWDFERSDTFGGNNSWVRSGYKNGIPQGETESEDNVAEGFKKATYVRITMVTKSGTTITIESK